MQQRDANSVPQTKAAPLFFVRVTTPCSHGT